MKSSTAATKTLGLVALAGVVATVVLGLWVTPPDASSAFALPFASVLIKAAPHAMWAAVTSPARSAHRCSGDDCDYIFDLGRRQDFGIGFGELCRRFYAALHLVGRTG